MRLTGVGVGSPPAVYSMWSLGAFAVSSSYDQKFRLAPDELAAASSCTNKFMLFPETQPTRFTSACMTVTMLGVSYVAFNVVFGSGFHETAVVFTSLSQSASVVGA